MEASQTPQTPVTPTPAEPVTTDDVLRAILAEQKQYREQIAELQGQLAASRPVNAGPALANIDPVKQAEARMADIQQHDFYCPGCGALYDYRQKCTGRGEAPHQATEVVSTDELKSGDQSKHTPALASV